MPQKVNFNFSATTCGVLIAIGLLLLGVQVKKGLNSISDNQRVVTVRGLSEKEVSANKSNLAYCEQRSGKRPSLHL